MQNIGCILHANFINRKHLILHFETRLCASHKVHVPLYNLTPPGKFYFLYSKKISSEWKKTLASPFERSRKDIILSAIKTLK